MTTEDEKGYNGWANYETWAVALWIDNDEGTYNYARELVKDAAESDREHPRYAVADALKSWQEEEMPDLDASIWSDLLAAAFGEVDWYEIADNYLSEITEDAES